jgi:hypothetical protein
VSETLLFRSIPILPSKQELAAQAIRLDFIPLVLIDCAWRNYYHWLCLALPKMMLSRHIRGLNTRIVIPDYAGRAAMGWPIAFSETVWMQSLIMTDVAAGAVRLKPGIYTADRIALLWLDSPEPALLSCLADFNRVFDPVRAKLSIDPALPKRILVARRAEQRLSDDQIEAVDARARRHGFFKVYLEDLDFFAQAQLFFNAEAVIATHGAGMSNLVFGHSTLRVLELNQQMYGEDHLRPWFYLLAASRNQTYFYLDGTRGEIAEPFLGSALERLCDGLPSSASPAPWLSL